ncbi:unnamed protein product [Trichobilharzia szidati]|nr:unnamed protein product [Trichobilharzia szidati]
MRPHVKGVLFNGGISQAESLFSKYPDLISIIPLHQNLSDGESLWVDHYRGPFLPETLGASTTMDRFIEEAVKWRRLILLNSNQYPTWMSEIHYSTECLINEIIFVTAGLSPDGLKSKDEHIRPEIFSSTWWDYLKSKSASGIEQRYTKSSRLSSNDLTYSPNTAIECVQTTIAKSLVDYADKLVSGLICGSLNKLGRGKTNKLSNSGDRTLLKKSQIGRCHSNQRTLSVFTPLNSSDLSGKLCKNISKSTAHHFNPSYKTSSCSNQCKIIEQGKLNKPIVYYASDLVKESVNYAQNVSTLHIHQLNVYSDKLVANILQSANKLLNWSNQLSKQILTEVKYSNNLGINNNIKNQNVMNSTIDKEVVENNKTNTTNSEKHPMNEDFQQCRISQPNNDLNSHEKYSILNKDNSVDDQSCQTMSMDSEMKIVEESSLKTQAMKDIKKSDNCIFPKTNPIIVCEDGDHTNSKKSVFKCDSAKHKLPQIFVSENLSEFANSLVVKCITLAFGEIYIQRMSSYLNHGSINSDTENNNNNDLDDFESKYYNSSNIRPPGLILDAIGEEYPSNYYSDPQMKVLIQWISAALVYSSPCCKFKFLANKMNSSTQDKIDGDYNHSPSELKEFKDQIAMEHSCSPLICCTNGDVKLKKLQTVVSLVYKASWNAGDLFCAMLDYCHYRSQYLAQTTSDYNINDDDNIIPLQCNYSLSPQLISKPLLSLFDFLILQLQNIQ